MSENFTVNYMIALTIVAFYAYFKSGKDLSVIKVTT